VLTLLCSFPIWRLLAKRCRDNFRDYLRTLEFIKEAIKAVEKFSPGSPETVEGLLIEVDGHAEAIRKGPEVADICANLELM
jgi:hypothetical protein